jgi:hypothetical protein
MCEYLRSKSWKPEYVLMDKIKVVVGKLNNPGGKYQFS